MRLNTRNYEKKHELEGKIRVVRYFEIKNSFERLHESILEANKNKKEEDKKLTELAVLLEESQKKLSAVSALIKSKGEDEQIEIKRQVETLKGLIARKKDSLNLSDKRIADNLRSIETSKHNIESLEQE